MQLRSDSMLINGYVMLCSLSLHILHVTSPSCLSVLLFVYFCNELTVLGKIIFIKNAAVKSIAIFYRLSFSIFIHAPNVDTLQRVGYVA